MSNMLSAIGIAASGMTAESLRMDVTSNNLANADSTGGPGVKPYQREEVVVEPGGMSFSQTLGSIQAGVHVTGIVTDTTPGQQVYDPGNPAANKQGYVTMPNVDPVTEMTDLIDESRSYEADTQAMSTAKDMAEKAIEGMA